MKAFVVKAFVIVIALIGLTSCDWTSDAPQTEHEKLVFEKTGGTQTNTITMTKHTWGLDISRLYIPGISEDGTYKLRIEVDAKAVKKKALPNGSTEIHYDWVTFIVSKDLTLITVKVAENKTGKSRSIFFVGPAAINSVRFTVLQKG